MGPKQSSINPHSSPANLEAFTCWVLRVESVPSDWHTRLSSPVSAPESTHAFQPQTTAFYVTHRKHLGQPSQSLQFKRRCGKKGAVITGNQVHKCVYSIQNSVKARSFRLTLPNPSASPETETCYAAPEAQAVDGKQRNSLVQVSTEQGL